jgi:rRNA maturation endonuclease Nob1
MVLIMDLILKVKYEWVCRECGDKRGCFEDMLPVKHCVKCGGVMELRRPRYQSNTNKETDNFGDR